MCSSHTPKLIDQSNASWTFSLTPSKTCPYEIVRLTNISARDALPTGDYPLMEVDAFETIAAYQAQPHKPDIACNMQ